MILEDFHDQYSDVAHDFITFTCEYLGIERPPINFVGTDFSETHKTFGTYSPSEQCIQVCVEGRHIMDVFRTLAHELVHHRQITQNGSQDIAEMESEANTVAALIMRQYGKDAPEMFTMVNEDAAVNSAGSGGVAGIGIGPQGEPGVRKKKFAGAEVFEVDSDAFHKARFGKKHYGRYRDYVGEGGAGTEIRDYGNRNYGRPIVLQNKSTSALLYLRHGRQ